MNYRRYLRERKRRNKMARFSFGQWEWWLKRSCEKVLRKTHSMWVKPEREVVGFLTGFNALPTATSSIAIIGSVQVYESEFGAVI